MKEGQFYSKLCDKKDGFNFSIVRLPYKYSNIPSKMFYSTISAEILRICRATSSYNDFLSSVYSCIKKQGAEVNNVIKALSKISGLGVLTQPPITSVKNILLKKTCYLIVVQCSRGAVV